MTDARYIIREATPDDAEKIIAFMKVIADEPDNGTSYSSADEFVWTVEEERDIIKKHAEADNYLWLVAMTPAGELIGHVNASGGRRCFSGTLTLGITVAKAWRNQGVGKALMQTLIDWCRHNRVVHRLHLEVFANNPRAIHVYEKLGFQREGVWRRAAEKHGQFLDLIQMAMIFERDDAESR